MKGSRIVAAMVAVLALAGVVASAEAQAYRRWYLAEGAANAFFNDTILIGNPNATAANVTIRLLPEGQPPFTPQTLVVQPTSRATFSVNGVAGLPPGAVSAIVESDVDIVVERSMTWPGAAHRGGHNSGGVLAPAAQWYFAEGVTGFFETFVLVTNTNSSAAVNVEVTFLRETNGPIVQQFTLRAERAPDDLRQQRRQGQPGPADRRSVLDRRAPDRRRYRRRSHRRAGDVLEPVRGRPWIGGGHGPEHDLAVRRGRLRRRCQLQLPDLLAARQSRHDRCDRDDYVLPRCRRSGHERGDRAGRAPRDAVPERPALRSGQRGRARQRLVLDPRVERSAGAGRAHGLLVVERHHLHRGPQLAGRDRRSDQMGLCRRHRRRRPAGRPGARFLLPDLERQRHPARGPRDVRARGRPRRRRHPDHPGAVARDHPDQRRAGAEPQAVRRLHRIDQRAVAGAVRRRARDLLGRWLLTAGTARPGCRGPRRSRRRRRSI